MVPKDIKRSSRQSRPLPLVVLADDSGSMAGNKIHNLNQALSDLVRDMQNDQMTADAILFSLITFGSAVREVTRLEPIKNVKLPQLSAQGSTSMGQAFRVAQAHLSDPQKRLKNSLLPLIVLISDGQPTDEWQQPLEDLKRHPLAGKAVCIALAIGADANRDVLQQFVSSEYPVLEADQSHKIKGFFKLVTWASKQQVSSQGKKAGAVSWLLPDLQETSEIGKLAAKYPRLSKTLIQRHLAHEGPRVGRTQAQKEDLLKVLGMFEGPGNLSETLDEHLHKPTDWGST